MSRKRARSRDEEHPVREAGEQATEDRGETSGDPDVLLDVPALDVEELKLKAEQVRVRVSFGAQLGEMVKINVGLEAEVEEFELEVKGVGAQAQLKARLDNVRAIFSEVLSTLERNPDLVEDLLGDLENDEEPDEPPRRDRREIEAAGRGDVRENGESPSGTKATRAAREKARRLGVDLGGLEGSGSGGRVLVRDVREAAGK